MASTSISPLCPLGSMYNLAKVPAEAFLLTLPGFITTTPSTTYNQFISRIRVTLAKYCSSDGRISISGVTLTNSPNPLS